MIKKLLLSVVVMMATYVAGMGAEPGKLIPIPPSGGSSGGFPEVTAQFPTERQNLPQSIEGLTDEQIAEKVRELAEVPEMYKEVGKLVEHKSGIFGEPYKGALTAKTANPIDTKKVRATNAKGAIYNTYGYISKDYSAMNSDYNYTPIRIVKKGDECFVSNIYGVDTLSRCTIDETARTISIPAQKIADHSTYGEIWIIPIEWNGTQGTIKKNGNITGTFNADGSITLGGWGVFVYSGPSAGATFNYYFGSEAIGSNATANVVTTSGTKSFISLVEQPYSNLVNIYNLGGNGTPLQGRVNSDGTVTITPQYMLNLSMYGDFFIYQYDAATNKINTQGSIIATYQDGMLTIPGYAIVAKASTNVAWLIASSAQLTCRDFTLQVPEPVAVNFEGEGTEASPYLIKNSDDMIALSQSVSDGHTYRGKFFRVANNFSMKGAKRAYQAAGDVNARFAGVFDGNGKTISDLEINGMGFNYQGVFGYVDTVATIKNLTLDNIKITGTGQRIGGVAGELAGKIENVHITNGKLVSKGDMLGGITAYSQGTVENCSYSGTLTGRNYLGGMVAFNLFRIAKCWSDAVIYPTGDSNNDVNAIGGIVGTHYSATRLGARALVTECWFSGIIDDQYGYSKTAGIGGYLTNAIVEKCVNVGIISGSNANNNATPDDYDASETHVTVYDNGTAGICAVITTTSEVNDCLNAGTVLKTKTSNRAAGIVGYISLGYSNNKPYAPSTITNCINTGYIASSPNDDRERRGIWGATWVKYGFDIGALYVKNCWSDNQATGLIDTIYGKQTPWMISGNVPEGFSSEIWEAVPDRYLSLKAFKGTQVGALAAANHLMNEGESIGKFKGPGRLNADSGIDFYVYANKEYVKSYEAFSISGNVTTAGTIYDNVLMIARTADGKMMKYMPAFVIPTTWEGRGTQDNPYMLRTVADFKRLNTGIEALQAHNFDYFKLANDIDFGLGSEFNGFAAGSTSSATEFGGVFDGNGKTISGLKVKGDYIDAAGNVLVGSYPYAGLFHIVNKYGVIKNLTLASNCQIEGYTFTGAFAGYGAGRFENCRNHADVRNLTQAVGGIVGGLRGTGVISGCYNSGNIVNGKDVAGGIAGYNLGRIELSQNDGNVTGKILSPINDAVTAFVQYGGIAGYANAGITDRCVNNGNVTAAAKVGGINGSHGASDVLGGMYNSLSTGVVETITSSTNVGGISGFTENGNVVGTATGLYFDNQMTPSGAIANSNVAGTKATLTSELVNGKALEGLDATSYNYKEGGYPMLAAFADEENAIAKRSSYLVMASNQNRANITSEATLSANGKLTWALAVGKAFAIEGNKLKVSNNTGAPAADTLRAYWDGKLVREICIGNVPSLFVGAGTEADPYQLRNVEDMANLALTVNENGLEYGGSYFKVMNDITYTETDVFTPISIPNGSMKFQGVIDGAGHTISGYKYVGTLNNTGMFGTLGERGVIKNLTVAGEMAGNMYTGGLVGKLYGRIENCVNASTVTSSVSNAGGLAAYMYEGSVMFKCVNKGKVGETKTPTGTNTPTLTGGLVAMMDKGSLMDSCSNIVDRSARSTVGGLASKSGGVIRNSYNTGNITSTSTVGGLVGSAEKTLEMYNCWNTGNVTGTGTSAQNGGLVGSSSAAGTMKVENCWNSGNVSGQSSVGGLFGTYPTGAQMRNCVNRGDVTGTSTNVGGLGGTCNGSVSFPSVISNCVNYGTIIGPKANLGGLCGNIGYGLEVDSCVNYGKVEMKATVAAGSIGGCVGNLAGVIRNCWNAGEVLSNSYSAGGVVGSMSAATSRVYYCVNVAPVTSTAEYGNTGAKPIYGNAAGIVGSSIKGTSKVANCANFGAITAPDMVAGVIGAACIKDTIINSFNVGKVTATKDAPSWVDPVILFYQTTSASTTGTLDNVVATALYYDSEVNTAGSTPTLSTGLSSRNMMNLELEGFLNAPYCYPMVSHLSHAAEVNLYSVGVVPEQENATLANLTGRLMIGQADHLVVKGTEHFRFKDNGVVETVKKGEGLITISTDSENNVMTREIKVKVDSPTNGIDGTEMDSQIVDVKYYDLNGHRVESATKGEVVIRITEYENGTRTTDKIVVR